MSKALVAELRRCAKESNDGESDHGLMHDAANEIERLALCISDATQGWVSVEERLPEAVYGDGDEAVVSDDMLICCNDTCEFFVANFDHEERAWYVVGGTHIRAGVTHWMTLPKGPK